MGNHCNHLYCIEEVSCSTSIHHGDNQKCYNANWWGSFDRRGWSTCKNGYFITGFWRNSCHKLYCIEEAKCCTSRKRWSECNAQYHLVGLYRNHCHDLYCIEEAKC